MEKRRKMEAKVETQKLLDALTDHMSIYHMKKLQLTRIQSAKSDRKKVVDWLAGLNVKQRQAVFTVVDQAWVTLLVQMQEHVESEGPGSFFVLPDFVPRNGGKKHGSGAECSLPGLCFRRARGLIRRLVPDGQPLLDSLRLYSSRDGEAVNDLNEQLVHPKLDCLTLSYELLEKVDRLVELMDKVSFGQFLEKQCLSGGSSWDETPWLKSMGYYSLAAFVANRLEISLWSAWVSALGAKQPSKSIPRLLARNAVDTATMSCSQCTKRQGFEDWWNSLHVKDRGRALDSALARSSRLKAFDPGIYKKQVVLPQCCLDNKQLGRPYVGLLQLISLSRLTLSERLVYSSLSQVHSCSERIAQTIRNMMMKVMKDSVEHDLLSLVPKAATSSTKKIQVKSRKGKGKKQKRHAVQRSCTNDEPVQSEKTETLEASQAQPVDISQDTGWLPGKKKKRNKREKVAKAEATPSSTSEPETNLPVDNTIVETTSASAVEADDTPELHETSEAAKETGNHQAPAKTRRQTGPPHQVPGLPPYVKHHSQAFHPVVMSSPHEWPGAAKTRFPVWDVCASPAATEWLHLDVNREWHHRSKPPLGYSPRQNGQLDPKMQRGILPTYSWDWPPLFPPFAYTSSVDVPVPVVPVPVPLAVNKTLGNDMSEPGAEDDVDHSEQVDIDDYFDAEGDLLELCDGDYNQFFGGGVMYWTSADYTGVGASRPGSLSSEDSSWARREAFVVDDIVGLTPVVAPYPNLSSGSSTMTCTSPSSASTVSFDHLAEAQGGVLAGQTDGLGYEHGSQPNLPPIVVRRSGDVSKLDGPKPHETRSPHVPRGRKEVMRWKRSPSPVLRCVPPAPPPPPPSPVAGVRRKKAFNAARSGSSSPRNWTVVNWTTDPLTLPTEALPTEALMSKGYIRCIPNAPFYPISGALLRERLIAIPSEQEHPDAVFPMQTSLQLKDSSAFMAKLLKEIEAFCVQVATENAVRKPFVNTAVKKVTHALQVLWPRSRTRIFGSTATGLALPNSDVDLVVRLPPVRNLEPIKEAGILEGRNGIKETCLQHAARYLADQDWVKTDSLRTIENTAIPIIIMVANCFLEDSTAERDEPDHHGYSPWGTKENRHHVRLDISFESPTHSGLHTAALIKELVSQFPAITPLALVLKQFLMDRGLDRPYTGGLSSYCLVLLITRFLQRHNHNHLQIQSLGSLLMNFLHFYGRIFDPRTMCISIRAGGKYISRDRLHGIDPLYVEDPLNPVNNVGRNCFRVLQCTKAFADAYVTLEKVLLEPSLSDGPLLPRIIPSISAGEK